MLATINPGETGGGIEAGKRYCLLVWGEILVVLIVTLVGSGASIAEEGQNGTWQAICLTDLRNREIARGKLLGSLPEPALSVLLALPAQLTFAWLGKYAEAEPLILHSRAVVAPIRLLPAMA